MMLTYWTKKNGLSAAYELRQFHYTHDLTANGASPRSSTFIPYHASELRDLHMRPAIRKVTWSL